MTHYEDIQEIALDNYGLVTYAQAKRAGIAGSELDRFVVQGRLAKVGRGVYQVVMRNPTPRDRFAQAVALAGEGCYLRGTAVLALLELASVNPAAVEVASPRRNRKSLPSWVAVTNPTRTGGEKSPSEPVKYHGIPCQHVRFALYASREVVMADRLQDAAQAAFDRGLLTAEELRDLQKGLSDAEA